MYGVSAAYGILSLPLSTAKGINSYFNGYIQGDNMKFRAEPYNFKENVQISIEEIEEQLVVKYSKNEVTFDRFNLKILPGQISAITVLLGQNGSGKTTFLNCLAKTLDFKISYKYQYNDITKFELSNKQYPTVRNFLMRHIRKALCSEMFKTDVLRPLNIKVLNNKYINKLSGGELQRVMITYCLGTDADVFLLDEPSACLDIEQRVIITKVIKRFLLHNKKIGFIVEHDMMMAMSLGMEYNSKIIVFDQTVENSIKYSVASKPIQFKEGINKFLKQLDITFKSNNRFKRPRINKKNSVNDREQKKRGDYYC